MKSNRPSKYRSVKTTVDGITFDSKKEAARYCELRLMEMAGLITHLELQPKYDLVVNGVKVCRYVPDFMYIDFERKGPDGQSDCTVCEDVKSEITRKNRAYRIKIKLFRALFPGVIIEER